MLVFSGKIVDLNFLDEEREDKRDVIKPCENVGCKEEICDFQEEINIFNVMKAAVHVGVNLVNDFIDCIEVVNCIIKENGIGMLMLNDSQNLEIKVNGDCLVIKPVVESIDFKVLNNDVNVLDDDVTVKIWEQAMVVLSDIIISVLEKHFEDSYKSKREVTIVRIELKHVAHYSYLNLLRIEINFELHKM